MSDLVRTMAWVTETPDGDHATLFVYPATDFDEASPRKLRALANLWGLATVARGGAPAATGVPLELTGTTIVLPGGVDVDMARAGAAEAVADWVGVAAKRRRIFLILTAVPLASPDDETAMSAAMRRPDRTWYGLAPLRAHGVTRHG